MLKTLVGVLVLALIASLPIPMQSRAQGSQSRAVYLDSAGALFSVALDGTDTHRLSLPSPNVIRAGGFRVSSTGYAVYFTTDNNIYSVALTGGDPVKLNSAPLYTSSTSTYGTPTPFAFQISPNGKFVVFVGTNATSKGQVIYSVPIEGGAAVALSPETFALTFEQDLKQPDFFITQDSRKVVFRAYDSAKSTTGAYAILIGGGRVVQLNSDFAKGGTVEAVAVDQESGVVVYFGNFSSSRDTFYLTSFDGGYSSELTISGVYAYSGDTFLLTPGGKSIVLLHSGDISLIPLAEGQASKIGTVDYNAKALALTQDGGTLLAMTGSRIYGLMRLADNVFTKIEESETCCIVNRDGTRLLGIDGKALFESETWAVPRRLNRVSNIRAQLQVRGYGSYNRDSATFAAAYSPDSANIVYIATGPTGRYDLMSQKVGADGPATTLNLASLSDQQGYGVAGFSITADSGTVIYTNDQEWSGIRDLYAVPIGGGKPVRLTPDSSPGVTDFTVFPAGVDSTR